VRKRPFSLDQCVPNGNRRGRTKGYVLTPVSVHDFCDAEVDPHAHEPDRLTLLEVEAVHQKVASGLVAVGHGLVQVLAQALVGDRAGNRELGRLRKTRVS
jgi:hypothetical protein